MKPELVVLPVEVSDESWLGVLFPQKVLIHPDRLEWCRRGRLETLSLSSLSQIAIQSGHLRITGPDGRCHSLKTRRAETLRVLIEDLRREQEAWTGLLERGLSLATVFGPLAEILTWRGRPYVAAVDILLQTLVREEVSDCHLEPGETETRVTVRRRGEVATVGAIDHRFHQGLMARLKALSGCHPHLSGIPQEGVYSLPGAALKEARMCFFPSLFGDRCAVRLISPAIFGELAQLGWETGLQSHWKDLIRSRRGLYLIVGPVGSGKTTALYATLLELARGEILPARRIVTIEDPVEARLPGICQSSVDGKNGLGLAQAFKHLLRQDPDVLALGEIRDGETLREALQAGLTGHLVLATFHAESASAAKDRIRQMGVEPYLLECSLKGILSLTLERTACAGAGVLMKASGQLTDYS